MPLRNPAERPERIPRIVYSDDVILAQALGEYAGISSLLLGLASAVESATQWVEFSVRENSVAWMVGGAGLLCVLWMFRGR